MLFPWSSAGCGHRGTGWTLIDPLLSLVIGALIVTSSLRLLRESLHGLMEGVPLNLSLEEIGRAIAAVPGVASVHELHIWSVAPDETMLSAHVLVDDLRRWEKVLADVRAMLHERHGIGHVTLQPEPLQQVIRAAAAAQYIDSCYTRIEGILKFVASEIDDEPLTGEQWHARMLARMARARGEPAARPRVIGAKTCALLDELRQFRHVVRNACSDRLRENDAMQDVNRLKRALSSFERDFGGFVAYMRGEKPASSRVPRSRASRRRAPGR